VLTLIPDLPAGVVGVEARGKVTTEDYEQVLVPAVDSALAAAGGKVRILYVLGSDFPDFSAGAVWQDTKLGLGRIRSWERVAVVTDAEWLRHAVHGLGWMMPGDVRVFASDELGDARAWVTT
jgi:SpoIIAA-like